MLALPLTSTPPSSATAFDTAEASLDADVEVFDVPEAARGAGAAPEPDTREHTIEEVFDDQATLIRSKRAYEAYNSLPKYSSTIDQVASSSAGLLGYANSPLGKHIKVNESSLWEETMVRKTVIDYVPCVDTSQLDAVDEMWCVSKKSMSYYELRAAMHSSEQEAGDLTPTPAPKRGAPATPATQ